MSLGAYLRVMLVDVFVFVAVVLLLFFCVLFAAWCQAGLGDDCLVSAYNLADE
jgi:hypothetical protein